jgi:uncharacterized protein (DUF58 family)
MSRVLHRRAVVFVVSDFQAPAYQRELVSASRRHDLIALPVVDPREETLPAIGRVTLEDAETGEQIEINTSRNSVRDAFAEQALERRAARDRILRQAGVDAIELRTGEDYVPALRGFFRRRERRLAIAA